MPKLLLVEDDLEFASSLQELLRLEQFVVEHVSTGKEADERLANYAYDLVILDWQLPDLSGPEISELARRRGLDTPILILTSRNAKEHRIAGLDQGADDYLSKPCDFDELMAHLRALLRRGARAKISKLSAGALAIEPQTHKVFLHDKEISLSKTEFLLLEFLLRHQGQVFDADALLNRVWSSESEVSRDLVKVYINKLRAKLKIEGEPPLIVTVHGVGYRLDPG
ncbi:MAG: response regulator transcription factor [Candidatus Obscuribacterales bacterium]|nr:response regulator transcription factor [Candidatus Obscuribacterales bacterium]